MFDGPDDTLADTLRIGVTHVPTRLDDPGTMDLASALLANAVFDTPCQHDAATGAVRSVLFDGEVVAVDDATWKAKLPEDLKLSNGEPVSVGELVDHLNRTPSMHGVVTTCVGHELLMVDEVGGEAIPRRLASWSAQVAFRRGRRLLGTGPYRVKSVSSQLVELERNPFHRGRDERARDDAEVPEQIHFQIYPRDPISGEATGLIEALTARRVDFTMDLTRAEVELVQGVRRVLRPGDSTCTISFNTHGAFARLELRRAAAQGLDREKLAGRCYRNALAYAAKGVLPPQLGKLGDALRCDPPAAREAIARLGVQGPLRMLRVWAPRPYLPKPEAVARELVEQFAAIGLTVRDEPATSAADFVQRFVSGDYDMMLGGWMADSNHPGEFFGSVLHSRSIPGGDDDSAVACNMARIADAELDRRIDACGPDASADQLREVQARVDELVPLVPLMYGPSVAVHDWRVQHLEWNDRRLPNFPAIRLGAARSRKQEERSAQGRL